MENGTRHWGKLSLCENERERERVMRPPTESTYKTDRSVSLFHMEYCEWKEEQTKVLQRGDRVGLLCFAFHRSAIAVWSAKHTHTHIPDPSNI